MVLVNHILEYNGGYIKYRNGKYKIATMSQIHETDERYTMLRNITAKTYDIYRYADENQGGSVYGTEVALVSQGTDTGETFLREKEARRLFGTIALCITRIVIPPTTTLHCQTTLNIDIRTDPDKPYIEYSSWCRKSLKYDRSCLY